MQPKPVTAIPVTEPTLHAEDPRWLERTARGVFCLMWLVPLDAIARLLLALPECVRMEGRAGNGFIVLRVPFAITASVFGVCAGWLLTRPPPAERWAAQWILLRPLVWAGFILAAVSELLIVSEFTDHPLFVLSVPIQLVLCECPGVVALCIVLARLSRTTLSTLGPTLAGRLLAGTRVYSVVLAVSSGTSLLAEILVRDDRRTSGAIAITFWLIGALALFVLSFVLAPNFYHLGHAFRRRGQAVQQLDAAPAKGFAPVVAMGEGGRAS